MLSTMRSWTDDQDNKYISIRYMWALVRLQENMYSRQCMVLQLCNIILHKAIIILASGKCVVRRFLCYANVIECTYTILDSIA